MNSSSFFFRVVLLACSAIFSVTSCQQPKAAVPAATEANAVGVAHLHERGFMEVMLRAQPGNAGLGGNGGGRGARGPNGETYFRCYKGDPDYEMYMRQVGGLKKGESKLIPPFLGTGM